MNGHDEAPALYARVLELEAELQSTRAQLNSVKGSGSKVVTELHSKGSVEAVPIPISLSLDSSIHNLMLLSDSALPLGSFAYSSGLESFLAHHKASGTRETNLALFHKFLKLSIQSMAYTNIPYALAAFRDPMALSGLDNDLDASTPCNVARRASIAQGRALLSVWERAFFATARQGHKDHVIYEVAATALNVFSRDLKILSITTAPLEIPSINGHFAPLWGTVCRALRLSLEDAAYVFLLNHAKAVVSAAVRASVMGPYMAQTVLASRDLQELIRECLRKVWWLSTEETGQVVPMLDLWIGRHELLYSRIFNS
ncbi:urease accessory protein [Cladophialophora yegresii CBS 114405]|uniref:Urease accessory protein n=1 Tax=Cladophialophora yegresii CBS 114405 TaxID=1182544 RepID=W9X228_9EURO|nr:urease accessory protein [Cladophialophora yegresii CBS 114405]EXJ64549.1 urease accessory protein [Cladophialophora yegresii CBS 114405]